MPAPPPPFKKPSPPADAVDVADVDLDFEEERNTSGSRAIASGSGPSSRSDTYAAGDVIVSKYRLKSIIGRGGMGSVWLAHNIALDIDVAVKLIRRDRAAPGAAERLRKEARAAARLRHPVIVRVMDSGESERGDPFIVMELLHGESLSTIIARKGRIAPVVAVQTLLPVAAALVEAHAKGIVHRDLKPDNILLVTDESGTVIPKVVDFGIAKLMYIEVDRQLTMAGEVLGSPDYMSPEQARGDDDVGEGTDVWALSVVLYEAITGRRPFDGPNYNALIAAILTMSPIPAGEFSDCDGDLWSILAKGLSKEPTTRWQSIRELGAALAMWAESRGVADDITGTSIAKQWILVGESKRLFTVFPEGEIPPAASSRPSLEPPVPSVRPSMPERTSGPDRVSLPPGWSTPPPGPMSASSVPDEWAAAPPFRKSRAPLIVVVAIAVLGVLGYVAVSMIAPSDADTSVAAGASASAMASSASPIPSVTAASTADPPASGVKLASTAPFASAKPASSTKPTVKSKPVAPKVPKHINF